MGSDRHEKVISIRNLKSEDALMVFDWRNNDSIVQLSSSQVKVTWEQHQKWIETCLMNTFLKVFIIEEDNFPIGQLRFDKREQDVEVCYVTIYLIESFVGKGLGTKALSLGIETIVQQWPEIRFIRSLVRSENLRSQDFFKKIGFELVNDSFLENHLLLEWSVEKFQTLENVNFYTKLLDQYGLDVKSLNWGSQSSQHLRFRILSQIDSLHQKSILDVGCGLGDFYEWLISNKINVHYTGIDITPKMIKMAKARFPEVEFKLLNILTHSLDQRYDYVLASGIFYLIKHEPITFMNQMISKMFELANIAIGFNSLSSWADSKEPTEFYADPIETLQFTKSLCKKIILKHDYHPADFSIFLYK